MTTLENEWESKISNLYDKLNPQPIDPSEEFFRKYLIENVPSNKFSDEYKSDLVNQLNNHLNIKIMYGLIYPEKALEYDKALNEWRLTKKKNFPGFIKLYRIKRFFDEEGITSKKELEKLFDTVAQLAVEC